MYYINRRSGNNFETVDEFETREEAEKMKAEYQMSEHGKAFFTVSKTMCSNWKELTV